MFKVYDLGTGEDLARFLTHLEAKNYARKFGLVVRDELTGFEEYFDPEIGGWVEL